MLKKTFPHFKQLDAMDCGPTCIRMIAKYYGKSYSLQHLRDLSHLDKEGVSFLGMSDAAENIGFKSLGVRVNFKQLVEDVPVPCIAHWNQNHFVVVYEAAENKVKVADPAHGLIEYTKDEFCRSWLSSGKDEGVLLLLEPTPEFYKKETDDKVNKVGFRYLLSYLIPYKKFLIQLALGMLVGSLLQLILPFLTQAVVDYGINNQDIGFVYTILIGQLMLMAGRTSVDFIRSWILLHIGTRIGISIISDFLMKLMKLPLSFFDTKHVGDILQRIRDHDRVNAFLTSTPLTTLFSLMNFIVFSVILGMYSITILLIFLIGTVLYAGWIALFLKVRKELDYKEFAQHADNQSNLIQLITGMQEIRLNNCEKRKRWGWEHIQARLFKLSVKGLAVGQYQEAGSLFINETKNILITIISAKEVIDGNITLGMMMAISYIIGQLNLPISQLIGLITSLQDVKISLERLGEIHNKDNEENPEDNKTSIFPENKTLTLSNVSFQYGGPHSEMVLKDVNMIIPQGKVTAIVGTSGSGKTTLLKLLLKFYDTVEGEIKLGDIQLKNFHADSWRRKCGVVMQDGYIFDDSIANNIALVDDVVDKKKLIQAVKIANIQEFIETLPLAYNTKIGQDGHGLSQGQKQRILLARAVYKDPEYIFLDEATNALDANNEKTIMQNLEQFFEGRTVIVVAHRLSTVKKADQIVVIEKGEIVETGNHAELTEKKGAYYNLVKNQLELGN